MTEAGTPILAGVRRTLGDRPPPLPAFAFRAAVFGMITPIMPAAPIEVTTTSLQRAPISMSVSDVSLGFSCLDTVQ